MDRAMRSPCRNTLQQPQREQILEHTLPDAHVAADRRSRPQQEAEASQYKPGDEATKDAQAQEVSEHLLPADQTNFPMLDLLLPFFCE